MAAPLERGEVLRYVIGLSKKHYEQIGFLPAPRLEEYAALGQLWHETENDEICGFLVWGNGWPTLRIYQVCIQYDARRREHGYRLVSRLISKAVNEGYEAIACYVANDIEANEFWRAAGFSCVGQRPGGQKRSRVHNHWRMQMPSPRQQQLIVATESL